MMDENAARLLPEVTVCVPVVDERVAGLAMLALQRRRRRDHRDAREVPLGPMPLLWLRPSAARQAREDDGLASLKRREEFLRVGQELELREEVRFGREPAPEPLLAKSTLEHFGRHTEDPRGPALEIR